MTLPLWGLKYEKFLLQRYYNFKLLMWQSEYY